jgi:predicted O-methyltransferase YrrM
LYQKIINSFYSLPNLEEIEKIRKELLINEIYIDTNSPGAPSRINGNARRQIKDIAKGGISSKKFSNLLYKLVLHFNAKNIWEFGTSLGINTLYLSSPDFTNVTTFEGCHETLELARRNFNRCGRKNIKIIEGNIDNTILSEIKKTDSLDLVFFDANHRETPTINYFETCMRKSKTESVFVFDDIHLSEEMQRAWEKIKSNPQVSLTLDLFQAGIVFFDHSLTKQDIILSY